MRREFFQFILSALSGMDFGRFVLRMDLGCQVETGKSEPANVERSNGDCRSRILKGLSPFCVVCKMGTGPYPSNRDSPSAFAVRSFDIRRFAVIISSMTLKRLMIILGILVVLAGGGIAWLWQYAYTPEGRARVIIAQLRGENDNTPRGWMLQHHLIRPGFVLRMNPRLDADDEPNAYVPKIASDAMFKLGRRAFPIVLDALKNDDPEVQLMAIRVCDKYRDPASIQPLAECLGAKPANNVWQPGGDIPSACVALLVEFGPPAYEPMVSASRNCDLFVKLAIIKAMVEKSGATAVPQLVEYIEDPDSSVSANAANELGKLKDKRATDALVRHLGDREVHLVYWSASALGQLGDRKAIPALLKLLHSPNRDIRQIASDAVATLEANAPTSQAGAETLAGLVEMLQDGDTSVSCSAASDLGKLKDKRAVDALVRHLGDSDKHVVFWMARALGEIGDRKAIPALLKALKGNSVHDPVPIAVAVALARMGQAEGVNHIQAMLKSPNVDDRVRVADELGATRVPGAFDWLLPMLQDEAALVRSQAVMSLGILHDLRAVPALKKRLTDPDPNVQSTAADALRKFGVDPEAEPRALQASGP